MPLRCLPTHKDVVLLLSWLRFLGGEAAEVSRSMSKAEPRCAQSIQRSDYDGEGIGPLALIDECAQLSNANIRAIDHLLHTCETANDFEKAAQISKLGAFSMEIEKQLLKHTLLSENQINSVREINRSLRRQFYEIHGRRLGTFDKMFGGSSVPNDR